MLDRLFALKAHGTSVGTEVLAGVTTFLTMAYIVVVNPLILGDAGMPVAGVAVATCLAAAFGSIVMGLVANVPLALAPGMGLNAYFTYTVVKGMGLPWETALGCVFLSGAAFCLLTLAGVRRLILNAMPRSLTAAVGGGIGLFIAFIGLKSAGVIVANPATTVGLGDLTAPTTVLSLLGLLLIAGLQVWKVRGAVLIGIVLTAVAGGAAGLVHLPSAAATGLHGADLTGTLLRLDIPAALNLKGGAALALVEIVFVFLFVDVFDNVGTLSAVLRRTGGTEKGGPEKSGPEKSGEGPAPPRLNRILLADSVATMAGAAVGVSTVTSYIESAAGVAVGGRTGLTSVVVGLLFLATLAVTPWIQAIPAAATAPALILVGALMMGSLSEVAWDDPAAAIPAFLTLVAIPLSYSIANGLAIGICAHAILKLVGGRARPKDWLLYVLTALFVARFIYLAKG